MLLITGLWFYLCGMKPNDCFVIDRGNTMLKVAKHNGIDFEWMHRLTDVQELSYLIPEEGVVVYSSVGSPDFLSYLTHARCIAIHRNTLPFVSFYENPEQLGMDRICNMAAVAQYKEHNRLVVDMGTCIKFDILTAKNKYLGGSISPGIMLRFKSLSKNTELLPELSPGKKAWNLIGNSTEGSILSGVMGGVQLEIESRIERYSEQFDDLKVYLTGGDSNHFDLGQKNHIFVDDYLTLKGIYALFKKQAT